MKRVSAAAKRFFPGANIRESPMEKRLAQINSPVGKTLASSLGCAIKSTNTGAGLEEDVTGQNKIDEQEPQMSEASALLEQSGSNIMAKNSQDEVQIVSPIPSQSTCNKPVPETVEGGQSEWQVVKRKTKNKDDAKHQTKPIPVVLDNIASRFTSRLKFFAELNRCQPELGKRIKVTHVTKLARGGISVHPADLLSFNHLLKPENWPNDAFGGGLKVHLPARNEERHVRVVIKNIEPDVPMQEIEQELAAHGFKEPKARRIGKSYLVSVELLKPQAQSLLKEGHINLWYFRHRVEMHSGDAVIQCFKCQGFGHIGRNCTKDQCCLRCSGKHHVSECKITETRCANCGGDHPAVAQKCPIRQAELERRAIQGEPKKQRPPPVTSGKSNDSRQTTRTYARVAVTDSNTTFKEQVVQECLNELGKQNTDAASPANTPRASTEAENHTAIEQCVSAVRAELTKFRQEVEASINSALRLRQKAMAESIAKELAPFFIAMLDAFAQVTTRQALTQDERSALARRLSSILNTGPANGPEKLFEQASQLLQNMQTCPRS